MQWTDVISNTGLDVKSVEPEASCPQCLAHSIQSWLIQIKKQITRGSSKKNH